MSPNARPVPDSPSSQRTCSRGADGRPLAASRQATRLRAVGNTYAPGGHQNAPVRSIPLAALSVARSTRELFRPMSALQSVDGPYSKLTGADLFSNLSFNINDMERQVRMLLGC